MAAVIRIVVETSGGVDAVKKDLAGLGDQAKNAGGGFSSLREVAVGALREVGSLAVNALGQAAQAVGGFLKDSISAAGDFQGGMLEFQAVAGKGVDTAGLQQFHDLFLSLGKELPVSTADVQKAAIELVKGGIDPATVAAGGLRQTIQFAAAAMGGDLAAAAEVSAKVVGGWADVTATAQEKADLLTHSTDLLTKAANASTVDVHDLALGLYNVQGTAKTVGLSLDETTTALAELAPRFSNANTAGTSFRNFLIRLQPTTKSASSAMEALGLITADGSNKFYDAQGNFVGVAKASQLLQQATEGLTAAEKTQALQTIFGNDAMNAAAAFAEMGADGYNNMTAALENANGVSGNAELKQQGLNTAMDNFKGSLEALQITIGEKVLPVLTDLFNNTLAPAVNKITDLATQFFAIHDATGSWTEAINAFVPGFKDMLTTADSIYATLNDNLVPILSGLAAMIITVAVPAFVAWAASATAAGIATVVALAPVVVPILAIGAAVALLAAAWENDWGGIRTTITDWWNGTGKPIFESLKTWLSETLTAAITTLSDFWTNTLKPALDTVWAFIQDSVIPIVKELATSAFDKLNSATQGVSDFWNNTLKPALNTVWSFIQTNVIPLLTALADVHLALVQRASDELAKFWTDTLKPALDTVWAFIDKNINPILQSLGDTAIKGVSDASTGLAALWDNTLGPALSSVGKILNDTLGPAWEYVSGKIQSFSDWTGGLSGIIQTAIDWLHKLAAAIRGTPSASVPGGGDSAPPSFAKGVSNFGGGLAYVHAGEILMNLSRGTSVIPARQSRDILNQQSTTNVYNLNFAPNYSGAPSERLDYRFAKSLAGVV